MAISWSTSLALQFNNRLILPIGCSCITSFELNNAPVFAGADHDAHFFDWMIATPDSTCDLLDNLTPFIHSIDDFRLHGQRIKSRKFPGLYFWHILHEGANVTLFDNLDPLEAQFSSVSNKYNYMIKKLAAVNQDTCCIWTNIQPNLKGAVENTGMDWADFVLTQSRYERLKRSLRRIAPHRSQNIFFVCRAEDVAESLAGCEDVYILDVGRGPAVTIGPDRFGPVFSRIAAMA